MKPHFIYLANYIINVEQILYIRKESGGNIQIIFGKDKSIILGDTDAEEFLRKLDLAVNSV